MQFTSHDSVTLWVNCSNLFDVHAIALLGTPCQLESVPDGDHYNSMLEDGIPRGIAWLKSTALGKSSNPDEPSDTDSKKPTIDELKPSD